MVLVTSSTLSPKLQSASSKALSLQYEGHQALQRTQRVHVAILIHTYNFGTLGMNYIRQLQGTFGQVTSIRRAPQAWGELRVLRDPMVSDPLRQRLAAVVTEFSLRHHNSLTGIYSEWYSFGFRVT